MSNLSVSPEGSLSEKDFFVRYNKSNYDLLSVSVDTVIFGIDCRLQTENIRKLDEQKLTVLLVKRDSYPYLGMWSLPGGFVGINEPLDSAAKRVLKNKTGISQLYLEQLYTSGAPERDPRMRIISCSYLSLIDRSKYTLGSKQNSLRTAWFEIEFSDNSGAIVMKSGEEIITIPIISKSEQNGKVESLIYEVKDGSSLAFDHAAIILKGLLRLRGKINYTDIAFNLMPERFTISQLQQIYEIILGQKLLAPLFRRQIAGKIRGTESFSSEKGHRPSRLYTYNGSCLEKEGFKHYEV